MRLSDDITRVIDLRLARTHRALDRVWEALDPRLTADGAMALIAPRDPFRALHAGMGRLLDDLLRAPLLGRGRGWYCAPRPAMRIEESDDAYFVRADLQGVAEEDIDVHLDGQSLTIRADRSEVTMDRGRRVLMGVRGHFDRRIALPEGIDTDRATAEMHDGVLTVIMPKMASRLGQKGSALKQRLRSWWSRLKGRGPSHPS